ncbi:MAG TPA: HEPN domain-containing protein [Candidatus Deferrimicrobium sp.]|nr:HEPN domain-containing protein [Candidatus Deferrimicrobium sp.]
MNNNENEFLRWFSQAKFDLEAAKVSLNAGNYEWACFQAQQAGEKALKSYLYLHGKRLNTPRILTKGGRRTMCRLCREDIIPDREINRKIIKIIHAIKENLNPSKIIIFGSFSRGDYNEISDLDLIVIGNYDLPFFKRIGRGLDHNPTDLDIEPLVYTEAEITRMINNKNVFISHVLEERIEV